MSWGPGLEHLQDWRHSKMAFEHRELEGSEEFMLVSCIYIARLSAGILISTYTDHT